MCIGNELKPPQKPDVARANRFPIALIVSVTIKEDVEQAILLHS